MEKIPGDGLRTVFEKGNRRFDPSFSKTSFKKKNSIKHSTDKTSETLLCRLCGNSTKTVRYIISGCKRLAHREHRKESAMTV